MQANRYDELFRENRVMTMEHLKMLTGRPRESILRDLKNIGYYSSYNERGKFYTLSDTPIFDDLGLWRHKNAYFSIKRTLLDTTEYLVNISEAGYTHDEIRQILGIGIQNTLYQLTIEGRIARYLVGGQYIYHRIENADPERRLSRGFLIFIKYLHIYLHLKISVSSLYGENYEKQNNREKITHRKPLKVPVRFNIVKNNTSKIFLIRKDLSFKMIDEFFYSPLKYLIVRFMTCF
jgi:hypothetical protein